MTDRPNVCETRLSLGRTNNRSAPRQWLGDLVLGGAIVARCKSDVHPSLNRLGQSSYAFLSGKCQTKA